MFPGDEEIFATSSALCAGAAVGLLVASSSALAQAAARAVVVHLTPDPAPIFTFDEAVSQKSFILDHPGDAGPHSPA